MSTCRARSEGTNTPIQSTCSHEIFRVGVDWLNRVKKRGSRGPGSGSAYSLGFVGDAHCSWTRNTVPFPWKCASQARVGRLRLESFGSRAASGRGGYKLVPSLISCLPADNYDKDKANNEYVGKKHKVLILLRTSQAFADGSTNAPSFIARDGALWPSRNASVLHEHTNPPMFEWRMRVRRRVVNGWPTVALSPNRHNHQNANDKKERMRAWGASKHRAHSFDFQGPRF
ncbi:hypothetical protein B0J18DRAFT_171219 [Chaetomium sp. MPI-SDFR-AT-0129]|nr:hypothetical protein B0J18DRAFT_171219 [Chaetomium sp. MPI-SDFR-AT-0129]